MRVLVIFAVLTVSYAYSAQTHSIVPIPFSRILPRNKCSDDNNKGKEYCSEDCRSIVSCKSNGQEEVTNCLASTGQPYCEQSPEGPVQCTTDSAGCISQTDTCPDSGMYPNLLDCNKFFYCTGSDATPAVCNPPHFIYHGGEHMCLPGIKCYNYDSFKGLCRGKEQVRLAYPLNPKLYVYCSAGGPKLRECNKEKHIEFDPKQGACVFVCPAQGLFGDPNDKEKQHYFECIKINGGFQATRRRCPDGTKFDEDEKTCKIEKGDEK